MTEAQAALMPDRLPWLPDEALPADRPAGHGIAGWLVAGAIVVAGATYVIADRTFDNQSDASQPWSPSTTAILPQLPAEPKTITAAPAQRPREATLGYPALSNAPAIVSDVKADGRSRAPTKTEKTSPVSRPTTSARPATVAKKAARAKRSPAAGRRILPTLSRSSAATLIDMPAARSAPSQISGEVIHLGAFADIRRAGAVWRDMGQAYPPLERFHPSLIQNRDWNGQPFYQFEVGTPSRSDSELLCQSMARLRYRCSVIGLRGKQTPQQQTAHR